MSPDVRVLPGESGEGRPRPDLEQCQGAFAEPGGQRADSRREAHRRTQLGGPVAGISGLFRFDPGPREVGDEG